MNSVYHDQIPSSTRRRFLGASVSATAVFALSRRNLPHAIAQSDNDGKRSPTVFQHACMTLPYSNFPLMRALQGIQAAGFRYVAWGVTHRVNGVEIPVLPKDAPEDVARDLAKSCRDLNLEPLMMFSTVYPEDNDALKVLTQRIRQASAAGVAQVLTFGHTQGGNRELWVKRLKTLGPIARDHNVTIVVKQHGGETGTGQACAQIIREVDDANIKVNYDAGNVMDYLNVDPISDLKSCANDVASFCIKDHRNWPTDQDCGPGYGEIDHYRLLETLAFTGKTIPLAYENILPPLLPSPQTAEQIDVYARRAREYLETVISGLQAAK